MRNEYLTINNDVMDLSDPAAPKISNLPEYLKSTKHRAIHRREILNTDFFHQRPQALVGDGN